MKLRTDSFFKNDKINQPQHLFSSRKKRAEVNKIRKERGEATINTTEIQKIIKHCYK